MHIFDTKIHHSKTFICNVTFIFGKLYFSTVDISYCYVTNITRSILSVSRKILLSDNSLLGFCQQHFVVGAATAWRTDATLRDATLWRFALFGSFYFRFIVRLRGSLVTSYFRNLLQIYIAENQQYKYCKSYDVFFALRNICIKSWSVGSLVSVE